MTSYIVELPLGNAYPATAYLGYDLDRGKFKFGNEPVNYFSNGKDYYVFEKNTDKKLIYGTAIVLSGQNKLRVSEELYLIENYPEYAKGDYIETIEAPDGTYPDNGAKDGFWYEKII